MVRLLAVYNSIMTLDEILPLLASEPTTDVDLAEIALLLAQEEYPAVDVEGSLSELSAMAHDLRPRLLGPLAARVAALARYLFHELGFRGNTSDYYDPRNSYFNQVLDRRTGLPITLTLVAVAVGERAGMTVQGVGLPGHFIARAVDEESEVLFDPFHGGRLLTPPQCEAVVERVTGQRFHATMEALAPVSPQAFLVRMLGNLKGVYLKARDYRRAARVIHRLCQLLPEDAQQQRDLGVSLAQGGQPGKALEHLEAYLSAAPQASDAKTVAEFLQKARDEVSKWN
jgi:regulator of sirC expression with transglutaminase-like and TPR domain